MSYWTALCFKGINDPNALHCTHKYLGELTAEQTSEVLKMINQFFAAQGGFAPFKATFNEEAMSGEQNDTRVLKLADGQALPAIYDELRQQLDPFYKDDFEFTPHVTTGTIQEIDIPFARYVLMNDEEIVKSWSQKRFKLRFENDKTYTMLKAIKESSEDFEKLEARIKAAFKKKIYEPLLKGLEVPGSRLENASGALLKAIGTGRISYNKDRFTGKFNSQTSKELKELGAKWNGTSFDFPKGALPEDLREAIAASQNLFLERLKKIDEKIRQILPAEFAGSIKTSDLFNTALWKVEKDLNDTMKGITVPAVLTDERRKKLADEWQENMKLWIKDFTEGEIVQLRKDIQDAAFAGQRYEHLIGSIQKSYAVSANKAKFLARQETSLLMAKFKETRYTEAGVNDYIWGCVSGSGAHPVRPSHKILEGKIFSWDNPPITTGPSDKEVRRNNPGQDYNCRCFARPIVFF